MLFKHSAPCTGHVVEEPDQEIPLVQNFKINHSQLQSLYLIFSVCDRIKLHPPQVPQIKVVYIISRFCINRYLHDLRARKNQGSALAWCFFLRFCIPFPIYNILSLLLTASHMVTAPAFFHTICSDIQRPFHYRTKSSKWQTYTLWTEPCGGRWIMDH